ncbi:MAG: hypothetical protein AAB464_01810 [Patescibacteria group bacterium]
MRSFRKIIVLIIILAIFSVSFGGVFVNKAKAGLTAGQAVGKAVGAGSACFLASKIESYIASWTAKVEATAEKASDLGINAYVVPAFNTGNAEVSAKDATTKALGQSKECIRDVMAKIMIDWIVDETVQWIQCKGTKGAECGDPAFVGNWGKFSQDAINTGIGEAINATVLAPLCSPFKLQVRLSLLPVERYTQRITCTLDDIVENIEDFYADFSKGGWLAYNEAWQPQNNYFGLMLMYQDEAQEKAIKREEAARNEALAGKGFLSIKRCVEYGRSPFEECLYGGEGTATECSSLSTKKPCLNEVVMTPGDTVGQAAASAITSDITWAANIKSWTSSLINAVINSITKRVIDEGLSYTQPNSETQDYSFDPYMGIDPDLGNKKIYVANIISDYETMLNGLNSIIAAKNQSLDSANKQLTLLNDLKTYGCQPSVSDGEISGTQTTIDSLTSEISSLQSAADEINANIEEANNISDKYTTSEVLAIENKSSAFSLNNTSLINGIYNGSLKSAAEKEAADNQAKLPDTQTKWNECVLPKLPLNATST